MGVVYQAVREADGKQVAVKTIIPAVAAGGQAVERLIRESLGYAKPGEIVVRFEPGATNVLVRP